MISSTLIETERGDIRSKIHLLMACGFVKALLDPHQMLGLIQCLEKGAGRKRLIHWGPRTLDLDIILAYDSQGAMLSLNDATLVVPHPHFGIAPLY